MNSVLGLVINDCVCHTKKQSSYSAKQLELAVDSDTPTDPQRGVKPEMWRNLQSATHTLLTPKTGPAGSSSPSSQGPFVGPRTNCLSPSQGLTTQAPGVLPLSSKRASCWVHNTYIRTTPI